MSRHRFLPGLILVWGVSWAQSPQTPAPAQTGPAVVLLHGLARKSSSMDKIARALKARGFHVCNIDYPSRKYPMDTLIDRFIQPEIGRCFSGEAGPLNFVTHSLGGILVRQMAARDTLPFRIGRVVMMSPPNQGSEVVDKVGSTWLFRAFYGPAGRRLGTDSASAPRRLGPASFELGIVAGTRSLNPLTSWMIPGEDDGEVSLKHMKLEGAKDYVEVPATHTFIPGDKEAIRQAITFLRKGKFERRT
jgi:triacylglycerol lipase